MENISKSKIVSLNRELKIEMNAKNTAYAFILSLGLFDEFKAFCHNAWNKENYKPHEEAISHCIGILIK